MLAHWRPTYYASEPVNLLGATTVRLPRSQVKGLRVVTAFLRKNCTTYWSVPGLNSFYLLSGETPPTGLNSTGSWWTAFSLNEEDEILVRLRHTPRLCLVSSPIYTTATFLQTQTPLVRYIERHFVIAAQIGLYDLEKRVPIS